MSRPYSRREVLKTIGVSAFASSSWWHSARPRVRDFDLLIIGGTLYDGSGSEGAPADLGIKNGKIAGIGFLQDLSPARKIEVNGLAVAPGFIDFHSHSDEELLLGSAAQSKIRQGVTTEVLGQDGDSMAPLHLAMHEELQQDLRERLQLELNWKDFAGYFHQLEQRGLLCNALSMVGQGTLRHYAVGLDGRPATVEEIAKMQDLAREAFAQGAYGISSGLEYTPGSYANAEEIIEVCRAMEGHGIYSSHMRNEDDTVIEALEEAIRIASRAEVALNVSHLKASGRRNWHKLPAMFARLDEARMAGMQVTCDRYPYVAYSTGLSSLFPLWSREGGNEKFVTRLKAPALRDSLKAAVMKDVEKIGGWASVMVSSLSKNPDRQLYEGRNMVEIAGAENAYAKLVDLIVTEEGGGGMVGFAMSAEEAAQVLSYPHCMIASDGSALATEGILRRGKPHPRSFGTFPRLLGQYVREDRLLSLPEAVRKITALPAETLGLQDRGYLRPNCWADVVVFDPATVNDRATWAEPQQYPAGIEYVLVNGEIVIDRQKLTGKLPGKVLRAPWKRS
ncbi:MAG: N-acyl-D-amino-acid deacylase family protein [bacterium]